ncbi:MAG: ParB/RepB/Spo0J family partition protein [Bacteroidota bacterium]
MAKSRKGGLGKGADAIFGNISSQEAVQSNKIPVKYIERNPYQPRQEFNPGPLQELADSIKVHGIIQPLTVRKLGENEYQLISGERRLRAAKLAKLRDVPAYVRTADDEQMLEMALIENIQRENLNPIEVALSYKRLIEELEVTQELVGDKVGKDRSTVTNYLGILELPEPIIKALREKKLSFGHARAIKGIPDAILQQQVGQDVVDRGLSVRQTEDLARRLKDTQKVEKADKAKNPNQIHLDKIEGKLEEKFGNKVRLKQKTNGSGDITIPFSNDRDLDRILEILDLI